LLEEIWIRHRALFQKITLSIVHDRSVVEDILQDTYTNLLRRRRTFETEEEAFNYLRRAVINTSIDYIRSVRRRQSRMTSFENWAPTADRSRSADPEQRLLRKEQDLRHRNLINEVQKALYTLTDEQRQAIELIFRRSSEKPLKEICKEHGIPYSTLRSRMLAGVDRLRQHLRGMNQGVKVEKEAETHGVPRN